MWNEYSGGGRMYLDYLRINGYLKMNAWSTLEVNAPDYIHVQLALQPCLLSVSCPHVMRIDIV